MRIVSSEERVFTIHVERMAAYEFRIKFDSPNFPDLIMDEPEPVGKDAGPDASRILAAAVGNCLSASLLFCLDRARISVIGLKTSVKTVIRRNDKGRWRIASLNVKLNPRLSRESIQKAKRCVQLFEDFCIVTQSVRNGIKVAVNLSMDAPEVLSQ